jgi:hypothetical protein
MLLFLFKTRNIQDQAGRVCRKMSGACNARYLRHRFRGYFHSPGPCIVRRLQSGPELSYRDAAWTRVMLASLFWSWIGESFGSSGLPLPACRYMRGQSLRDVANFLV